VQNAFGFGYGSPIRKDKLFYFASVEQNFVHAPYYVQFAPQAPGTPIPPNLAAQQGQIGRIAAEKFYEHAAGKPVEKDVKIPVKLVTRENAAEFAQPSK